MISPESRLAGGLWGLLVGDAVGVPYEFHGPESVPPIDQIDMVPPKGFRRAHSSVAPGTWSDDGAQALVLLASLLKNGRLDPTDFGQGIVAWYRKGYMAVGGDVFDVGIQTSQAIGALSSGVPALEAGPSQERANGNGSLMRVLPLALWHRGADDELVRDAHLQSRATHGHVRSQVCCAIYCLWARGILQGVDDAWRNATATLRCLYKEGSPERHELETVIRPDDPPKGTGSGYVLDCLHSARLVMDAGDYEAVVKAAVALGNDTDTTACVAGGIAGLRDGVEAIPARWMEQMRGKELVEPLLKELLSR